MTNLIAISEMAKLHGITRQTLIYYDEIDLFKPREVDENGYRYYSRRQIPYLREICFLKSVGVSLKDIVEHFQERCPEKEMELLRAQKSKIVREMNKLNKIRESISQRIDIYEEAVDANAVNIKEPFVKCIAARSMIVQEYIKPITKENLHTTLMALWKKVFAKEMVPSSGFGSMIRKKNAVKRDYENGIATCIFLPPETHNIEDVVEVPTGEYACMYKYGMPYDFEHVDRLLDWIEGKGYEVIGDVIDICLLDTTFYREQKSLDFCMLQIPIKRKK